MEKEAKAGQMVVSIDFHRSYHTDLESENFGFTPFTAEDRQTQLHLLVLPVLPERVITSNTKPFFDKMNSLKKDVQKIKTLGELYPDLDMEEQFIKLKLTTTISDEERAKIHREDDIAYFQHKVKKGSTYKQKDSTGIECDTIYEQHLHLFIKGIPGIGKTTILKYFCFKGFNEDKYPLSIRCIDLPNIKQWKKDYPYSSEGSIRQFMAHLVTFSFLYPNKGYNEINNTEKSDFAEILKITTQWSQDGKIIFCLDALDEVTDTIQQREILRLVTLWLEDEPGYRIYLTARNHTLTGIPEDLPLASINSIELSQFQELGERFFAGKEQLLKKFREASWQQQEVMVLIASTPLLTTLFLVWFKYKGKFARRPTMLRFITSFILLRIWDKLKNPDFQKSIEEIIDLASNPKAIEEDTEVSSLIDALEVLAWNALMAYEKGVVSTFEEETIMAILDNLFIAKISSKDILEQLTKNYFLLKIAQRPNFYTFIHRSILEFLATRKMEKLAINKFLLYFHKFIGKEELYTLEILPLFSALSFENLKRCISGLNKYDQGSNLLLRDGMVFRILVEAEGFIREQTDDYQNRLIIERHKELLDNFKTTKDRFLNRCLAYLETTDLNKLNEYASRFDATSRFQDKELLATLDYSLFEGEDKQTEARNILLEQMVHFRLVEEWKVGQRNLRRKEEKPLPTKIEKILRLNSKGYCPDDKNFDYYSKLIPELKGFFGSPNLKHSYLNKAVFSPDGKYILSASADDTLKLWDTATGKEIRSFKGHTGWVNSGTFSSDGKYILSASSDNTLKLWDTEKGMEIRTFRGHTDSVRSV